jgi:hypothetical protein
MDHLKILAALIFFAITLAYTGIEGVFLPVDLKPMSQREIRAISSPPDEKSTRFDDGWELRSDPHLPHMETP